MAKLTAAARRRVPREDFGLESEEKYPVEDDSHAINAKARAKQQLKLGNLSRGQYSTIVGKANRELAS